ncbi:hypothetical protein PQG02_31815 (plasmid) [Nostoc sp. UHCC 0926]|uniref:hypothetical protein n=1 Tax=Nostoc sp. UHCC 0926 TaxID=3025190 RepID=UPI0023619C3B|nr:hypothetical protein [Nostoc sp. UHCC 0926]WDD35993.1 hypothetical protein PQG02_31815 [Nostoc sp. UHCC 0926]
MNKEECLKQENEMLRAIAILAKRLLLSDEIPDATPEVMNLCELIEHYEQEKGELSPQLNPHGKKPWYAKFDEKGQVAGLQEILALSSEEEPIS